MDPQHSIAAAESLSLTHLVLHASWVVQAILVLLLIASVASWYVIFQKALVFAHAQRALKRFEKRFWSGGEMAQIYQQVTGNAQLETGAGAIFCAGYEEFQRQRKQARGADALDAARRAMRGAQIREVGQLEGNLPLLASISSVAPFVGLLGTVWGIMTTFMNIGAAQQATLATVAPPVAEALIATLAGLFAAIPATFFYNRFVHRLDELDSHYEVFMDEFTNILHRQTPEAKP
ncbi:MULTISPECIES: protein TolQ [Acidithiobacillus]|jgi:biopolymer transport protein TolQ|uniref:Tol-Pal system protein TolQ n=3 Tax=Acidithiobacillus caldus TaxID=33059 RepID=F9ZTW1_ACICS|nr:MULTISPECIES: protein TolQ [Acidithiobacillus]AEK59445.1 MotA/TolQ/ExbB proton channel family protein [Acidithiobacillus caldus SM-1]AIA56488.1 MotA/TolQ/ExbB proton channel family protein [Acidithiobacillus caldus ATCC 51756]AUW33811.1 protein TolQ [Acidithiobacillus caldus]MBU2730861.1 protein TolQ [Acidithiobacillus caldus]MBU2735540.1 protein TolQ [Acidithiobacillus caldus ATCC 51756]